MDLADRLFQVTDKYINSQVSFARRQVHSLVVLQQATLLEALQGDSDSLTSLVEKVKSGAELTVAEQATINAVFVAVMTISHPLTGY
jgi:hypothetical protein